MATIIRRLLVFGHDLVMVAVAWSLALLVRYDFSLPVFYPDVYAQVLGVVIGAQAIALWWSGLYRGRWRFASVLDLWNIVRAVGAGMLLVGVALVLYNRFDGVPRSVMVMYPVFLGVLLGAPRMAYRLLMDHRLDFVGRGAKAQGVLVLGAGRAGEMLVRDMVRDPAFRPLGLLDDNSAVVGTKMHGVPVLGKVADLPRWARELKADIVVIAMPSASAAQMRRVVEICEQAEVPFRTLPRLGDMVEGRPSTQSLREVSLDDLLGREPIALDWKRISAGLTGKTILVTGGGGSIGAQLCRQIARLGPARLVVFERSEYNLYSIDMELRRLHPDLRLHARLGDVGDRSTVEHVFARFRPDVVFHAAAYKHVPLLQDQVREAVHNNVIGTRIVAEAADHHRCESFVMISTDKAVNPANVMGASKRMAEIFCQTLDQRSDTRFITVRFGNVLGSAGSVIPLFKRQIAEGGPVTVTHREITRYFMTIPEACELITQAAVMGQGGEIFVLDMGEPVKVSYLAEQLIRLSGKVPGQDIEITYTGLRPGEKLYEELFHEQEQLGGTEHEKIFLARCRTVDWEQLQVAVRELEAACLAYDSDKLLGTMQRLVPELEQAPVPAAESNVVPLKKTSPE